MVEFIAAVWGLYAGQERDARTDGGQPAGQGLVEYALILSFIAIAVILALIFFGERLNTLYSKLANSIPT